ncbi:hypothetical protein L7F22_032195 [Adiantum nelumboides]|nr:hypothetical protein [Adiantum nelumboides]
MRRLVLLVPRQHPPFHVGVGLQRKDVAVPQAVQNTTNVTSHMLLWMYHGHYRIGRCWKSTPMLVCCRCSTTSRRPFLCFWPQTVHQVRISGAVHLTPEGAGDHISVLEKGLHGVNKAGGDDSWYALLNKLSRVKIELVYVYLASMYSVD